MLLNPTGSGSDVHGAALAAILLRRLGEAAVITDEELQWLKLNIDRDIEVSNVENGRLVRLTGVKYGKEPCVG